MDHGVVVRVNRNTWLAASLTGVSRRLEADDADGEDGSAGSDAVVGPATELPVAPHRVHVLFPFGLISGRRAPATREG